MTTATITPAETTATTPAPVATPVPTTPKPRPRAASKKAPSTVSAAGAAVREAMKKAPAKSAPEAGTAKTPAAPKAKVTTSPNPALKGKPTRTSFYIAAITRTMTAYEVAAALSAAGWPDEGPGKVTATLGYLVRTGRLRHVAGKGDKAGTFGPVPARK
jgi:hypothetical protein